MICSLAIVLLVALPAAIMAACPEPYQSYGSAHTMCKYAAKPCAATDANCKRNGITAADIKVILDEHNKYRNTVASGNQASQPKGANIREMQYNPELAKVAQRWTDQTTFGHDTDRRINGYWWVGQNVAIQMSSAKGSTIDFKSGIQGWFNEVSKFDPSTISPFRSTDGTGHYTQVLWADTNQIGCGFSYYLKDGWYNRLYVCNYAIGGNVQGETMYKTGEPASSCPNGKSSKYSALCA